MRIWQTKLPRALNRLRRLSTLSTPLSHDTFHPAPGFRGWAPDHRRPSCRGYSILDVVGRPKHDPDAWVSLLEPALPPHLRRDRASPSSSTLSAEDVARIILAAQYPTDRNVKGIDVLHHLGFAAGRWHAVVWLVKILADHFPVRHGRRSPLTKLVEQRPESKPLREMTGAFINLQREEPLSRSLLTQSLHELTDGVAEDTTAEERLQHSAMGQVWRTLGLMTQSCAGGEIKAEVLEIIAFLHHKEIMPQSIYHFEPNLDEHAIHTPPLLSLLSSRILTSLSDAAWRAHEKLIIEEAMAKGGEYAALRPEIPGSVYRVHVAGLRPELWMELILWSCLRGGWIIQGAEILQSLHADPAWKPVSWQDHAWQFPQRGGSEDDDWNAWEYRFKTRAPDTMDAAPVAADFHIDRSISSEVVSAYADALVTSVSIGVGYRGISMEDIVVRLRILQEFLGRSKLGLSTGTWDSLIVRLIDHDQSTAEMKSQLTQDLVSLSPDIHQRLRFSAKSHTLPDYISDGNSAMQGLLHRTLRGQIRNGYLDAALSALSNLLERADMDKLMSINNFFQHPRKSVLGLPDDKQMFTSNFSGIEYPAFDTQIPLETLASLMQLAMVHGAYDVVEWMIHNDDVEGPIVTPEMYNNRHIQPALLRYAAETDKRELFEKFTGEGSSRTSLITVLDTQISGMRWQATNRLMKHLCDNESTSWSPQNLAMLIRTILLLVPAARRGFPSAKKDFHEAQRLFDAMVALKLEGSAQMTRTRLERIETMISVLSTINPEWRTFCTKYMQKWSHHKFSMSSDAFNLVMEGIVEAYGSAAGRHVLGIFWPHAARAASDNPSAFGSRQTTQMKRHRPGSIMTLKKQRINISKGASNEHLVIYGAVVPNIRTILIILDGALRELQDSSTPSSPVESSGKSEIDAKDAHEATFDGNRIDTTPTGMVTWAIRRLLELPGLGVNLLKNLDSILEQHNMHDIRSELPRIIEEAGVHPDEVAVNHDRGEVQNQEHIDALSGATG